MPPIEASALMFSSNTDIKIHHYLNLIQRSAADFDPNFLVLLS